MTIRQFLHPYWKRTIRERPLHRLSDPGRIRYMPPRAWRNEQDYEVPSWFKHRTIDAFILWAIIGFPFYRRYRMRHKPIYKFFDEDNFEVIYFNDLQKYKEAVWNRKRFPDRNGGIYRKYEFDFGDRQYTDMLSMEPHFLRMRNLLTFNNERSRAQKWLLHRHKWANYTHKQRPNVGEPAYKNLTSYSRKWQKKFIRPRMLLNRLAFRIPWAGDLSQRFRRKWGKMQAKARADIWIERGNFPWFGHTDKIIRPNNWTKKKFIWGRRKWSGRGWLNHGQEGLEYLGEDTLQRLSTIAVKTGTGVGEGAANPGKIHYGAVRPHGPINYIKTEIMGMPVDNSRWKKPEPSEV